MAEHVIILEGARGTGKSSIAQALLERFKEHDISATRLKFDKGEDPYEDMVKQLLEMTSLEEEIVILDRFHVTQFVLRSMEMAEDSHPFDVEAYRKLIDEFNAIEAGLSFLFHTSNVVIVHADAETCKKRLSQREGIARQTSESKAAITAWNALFEEAATRSKEITIDTTHKTAVESSQEIADEWVNRHGA